MTQLNAPIDAQSSPFAAQDIAKPNGSPGPGHLKFAGSDRFFPELRKRVDAYFETTGQSKRDCPAMYFKTASILTAFFVAYALLVFVVISWWLVVPLTVFIGLAVAAIGFNIQHDGNHKAYSNYQWINKLMSLTLDMMGGSSYLWDAKHNSIHHTYTNIAGHDDDINVGFLARLSPQQPRYVFHRLQSIYLWPLYGFLAIKWHFVDDFYNVIVAKIGDHKIKRPRGKDLAIFVCGKIFFFTLAFAIPMMFHAWWKVMLVYGSAAFVSGVVLAIVFQLAHCVEDAEFPIPEVKPDGFGHVKNAWAIHQVQTTVDFARNNRVLSWLLGGLNFQIEHHLFHKICHVHYPALSKVVEEVCEEFGIRYNANKTFLSALGSHFRFLVDMGRPVS